MSTIQAHEAGGAEQSASATGEAPAGRGRPAAPSVEAAIGEFLGTIEGKSPRTRATYASALRRLVEHLEWAGLTPGSTPTDRLPPDVLERFYTWLVRAYGKERRFTLQTYVAGARAFFRFLVRRRIA